MHTRMWQLEEQDEVTDTSWHELHSVSSASNHCSSLNIINGNCYTPPLFITFNPDILLAAAAATTAATYKTISETKV